MSRLSRIAFVSALVGVAAASQALFYNSGLQVHPHPLFINYGQLDAKFDVRRVTEEGAALSYWRNPYVVTPNPEGFSVEGAPWSGDDSHAQHTEGWSPASRWLSPFVSELGGTRAESDLDRSEHGYYEYRYQFYLSHELASYLNTHQQSVVGRWSSDNGSIARFGTTTWTHGTWAADVGNPFRNWTTFELKNFSSGLNELTFRVQNFRLASGNNPTGLRVEFTNVPTGVPVVPEPFTMALGAGALALAVARRRKAKK